MSYPVPSSFYHKRNARLRCSCPKEVSAQAPVEVHFSVLVSSLAYDMQHNTLLQGIFDILPISKNSYFPWQLPRRCFREVEIPLEIEVQTHIAF